MRMSLLRRIDRWLGIPMTVALTLVRKISDWLSLYRQTRL